MKPTLNRLVCAALLAAAVWIAGCGPSTGGTGTGASLVGLQHYGATPQPLCAGVIAAAVGCVTTSPGANRAPAYFASVAGDVVATIDDDDIRIDARCPPLAFEGTWARSVTLGDRFYGAILVGTPMTDLAPASTAVQAAGDGSSLELTLRDANERTLLGPVLLLRMAAPPATAAQCPG